MKKRVKSVVEMSGLDLRDIPDLVQRLARTSYGIHKSGWKKWEVYVLGGTWPPVKGWKSEAIARLPPDIHKHVMEVRQSIGRRIATPPAPPPPKAIARVARKTSLPSFYQSWEWKKARYQTIQRFGAICMCCGSARNIVVDHIKPRRKFPELSLDLENLQVLCNDCNMGKSNDDYTDWRPANGLSVSDRAELDIVQDAIERIH